MERVKIGRRGAWGSLLAALAVATILAGAGCDQDETADLTGAAALREDDAATAFMGPLATLTLEEIDARVQLTADQREPMGAALERARAAHREMAPSWKSGKQRGRHGGRFGDRSEMRFHGDPPVFAFIEDASKILTPDQFVGLARLLAERREECREERGDRGSCGMGPGGPHGGRGGPGHFPGGPGIGKLGPELIQTLGLSDEQVAQLKEIWKEHREAMRTVREQAHAGSIPREEAHARMGEIRAEMMERMTAILTLEQKARWEELRAERIRAHVERRIARMEGEVSRHLGILERVLELEANQVSSLRSLLEVSVAERRAILRSVADGTIEMHEAMGRIRENMETLADQIGALLRPDQLARWEALRKVMPRHD